MAHRVRTWYSIVNKIMAIISIVLALLVIADCSFVIASVSKEMRTNITSSVYVVVGNNTFKNTYNLIVIVCASLTMICALAQFFLSLKMSLSCSQKAGIAMKIWISAHLVAFCITLFCILLPLFYPNKKDGKPQHHAFKDIHNILKYPKQILDDKASNYMSYYFLGLTTNGSFLLLFLIFTCCCLRCGQFEDYDQLK